MKINVKEIVQFRDQLEEVNKRGIPFAIRNTLNDIAFNTTKRAKITVKSKMVQRNNWTINSIRTEKAKGNRVRDMASMSGSLQPYMRTQEEGGLKRSTGKQGVPLTTTVASGEGLGSGKRKRLAKGKAKLKNIRLNKKRYRGNRQQRMMLAVRDAVRTGRRTIYLNIRSRRKGIFKVRGGSRAGLKKSAWPRGARLELLHDLTHKTVDIPRNPWLEPSITPEPVAVAFYGRRLQEQIERSRAFRRR